MSGQNATLPKYDHQMVSNLEVPEAEDSSRLFTKYGQIWLHPALWVHFVDLYQGAGLFKLPSNPNVDTRREHAFAALRSVYPELETEHPEIMAKFKAGQGFRVSKMTTENVAQVRDAIKLS